MPRSRLLNPALFICDIQEKFRPAVYEFPKVMSTAAKMVKAAKMLSIPIYITTQNQERLGPTVHELTSLLPSQTLPREPSKMNQTSPPVILHDKTSFSMMAPPILSAIQAQSAPAGNGPQQLAEVIIVGIETHICVSQTALDLRDMGYKVHVLADGVSSCNIGESKIALDRLANAGCTITTSEATLFELIGDAKDAKFKDLSLLVKDTKDDTKAALEVLCSFP